MNRSVRLRLTDMLDAITGIESTVTGARFPDYAQSWTMRRAVERGIEIISEASRHLPDETKARYPHLLARDRRDRQSAPARVRQGRRPDHLARGEQYLPELKFVVADLLRRESRGTSPKRTR